MAFKLKDHESATNHHRSPLRSAKEGYDHALAESNVVGAKFRQAQLDYRSRKIGDAEFLSAKKAYGAAMQKFDTAEAAYKGAVEKYQEAPTPTSIRGKLPMEHGSGHQLGLPGMTRSQAPTKIGGRELVRALQTGARGGQFYIGPGGEKVYVK